jgi:DNA invertase Pin-like site-specific DNA recombinase
MNIVLLKTKSEDINITVQQDTIIKYTKLNGLSLDLTELENSRTCENLEKRKEFKGFLRSLNEHDTVLIYDLWVYSKYTGELIKIFDCLLTRNITTIICSSNTVIGPNSTAFELASALSKFREKSRLIKKETSQGRPKGRMSKSKFDVYRAKIIEFLEEGFSVSKISRELGVSRTSLKDYINSRGLKDLVKAKKTLLNEPSKKIIAKKSTQPRECSLINEIKG